MSVSPLSVQLFDRILTTERIRNVQGPVDLRNAEIILDGMTQAALLQTRLGLGSPQRVVRDKKTEFLRFKRLSQAELLAEKFKSIQEPNEKFFPRFTIGRNDFLADGKAKGRPPELVMTELGPKLTALRCDMGQTTSQRWYEAPVPVIPPTVLELAKRAKQCAPDANFYLLFMPSWEPATQRDPVLVVHVPDTEEWFEIGAWNGDQHLIKEFLEDR